MQALCTSGLQSSEEIVVKGGLELAQGLEQPGEAQRVVQRLHSVMRSPRQS